jgi:signal peptidase I
LLRAALVMAVVLLTAQWSFMPTTISGSSMSPTLREGQFAVVFTQAYRFEPPKRGDLVLVSTEKDLLVKRVIGLPGENLAIHNSNAYVNGKPLIEPYLKWRGYWEIEEGLIGPGRYAIVGDNRSGSQTSSLLAIVNRERILGRLVYY